MKINLKSKIKDENGNNLGEKITCLVVDEKGKYQTQEDGSPVVVIKTNHKSASTIKDMILPSLLNENVEPKLTLKDKSERYRVWSLINISKTSVELTAEEITIVKKAVSDTQPILVMGQIHDLLEKK